MGRSQDSDLRSIVADVRRFNRFVRPLSRSAIVRRRVRPVMKTACNASEIVVGRETNVALTQHRIENGPL
jgi:hypothetical protein